MSPIIGRESIASYGAASGRWTDEYLERGVAVDLISRQRITRNLSWFWMKNAWAFGVEKP